MTDRMQATNANPVNHTHMYGERVDLIEPVEVPDEFVFEWRKGDKCKNSIDLEKYKALSVRANGYCAVLSKKDNCRYAVPLVLLTPRGKKTKARYAAEKLKWQQSRIKAGDWVELLTSWGTVFKMHPIGTKLKVVSLNRPDKSVLFCSGCKDLPIPRDILKPCDPPNPQDSDWEFI